MKKTIIVLGLVAVTLFGVAYVYAQGQGYGRMGWGHGKWSSLTSEQKTEFQELRKKFIDETAQLRSAIVTKRQELRSLWTDPKADPLAIQGKDNELRSLQDQMRDKAFQSMLEARNILTPEQLTQFGTGSGMGMGPDFGRGHGRCY
jgi:Spy/CpxP family protein refolding chaperone